MQVEITSRSGGQGGGGGEVTYERSFDLKFGTIVWLEAPWSRDAYARFGSVDMLAGVHILPGSWIPQFGEKTKTWKHLKNWDWSYKYACHGAIHFIVSIHFSLCISFQTQVSLLSTGYCINCWNERERERERACFTEEYLKISDFLLQLY